MTLVYNRLDDLASEGDKILDIGTKSGEHLAGVPGQVTAIDLTIEPTADIEYALADGRELPFADDCFDYVTAAQVLEHVSDKQAMLDEVVRVLKPDGVFLVAFPNRIFPLDPHGLPPFFPWLPKRVVLTYLVGIGAHERYDYVLDQCFYLTSLQGRQMLESRFDRVSYETIEFSVEYSEIFQSRLGKLYKSLLPSIEFVTATFPSGEWLFELLFRHTAYECRFSD